MSGPVLAVMQRFSLLLTLLSFVGGCSVIGKVDLGRLVTGGGRDAWQHPEQVIAALELEPGSRVAEIGAGSGYWLAPLSEAVGPEGRVYAVEVDDGLVAELVQRVESEGLDNVVVVRGRFEDPELPDGEIDLAMTCLTYHHIDDRPEYFRRLQVDLSPRGRVAHLDERDDIPAPIRWLQTSGHWSDPSSIVDEMAGAGYQRSHEYDFLPLQSFQVFVPVPRET